MVNRTNLKRSLATGGTKRNYGFSLFELMIVILIISIFAIFTYPEYNHLITQARRVDGQTALLNLANQMENYYSLQHTYQRATLGTGQITDISSTTYSEQNWYKLQITEQTDTYFSLSAVPIKTQATADKLCQILTFNHLGVKGITAGPAGPPKGNLSQCW